MIRVFDTLIPPHEVDTIERTLLGRDFPWYYLGDVTYENNSEQQRPGLSHYFIRDGKINSDYWEIMRNHTALALDSLRIQPTLGITNSRAFLQFPLRHCEGVDTAHTDDPRPHWAIIYYVNDSDGNTIIYNRDGSVREQIEPRRGRTVIFDGTQLHAGTQPQHHTRCIINSNAV